MFEIILLVAAASGIAAYARGRGGNTYVWGGLGVAGYIFIAYVLPMILASLHRPLAPDAGVWLFVASLAWLGVVAFCARFLLGRSREKPPGMWSCPDCTYLNKQYSVFCEACKRPYAKPVRRAS